MEQFFKTLPTVVYLNPKDQIQIIKAELTAVDFSLAVDLLNMSDEAVKKVTFAVKFKNERDEYLLNESESFFTALVELAPHNLYYVKPFSLDERFQGACAVEIRLADYYTESGKHSYSIDSQSPFTLPVIPEEKQDRISSTLGPEIKTYGENLINQWRCVCGAINSKDIQECRGCGRNKNFVLNNLTEPLINAKLLNLLQSNSSIDILDENEQLKANLTQTHLSKVAPTKESILSKRMNEVAIIRETSFRKILHGFGILFGFLIFACVVFIAFSFGQNIFQTQNIKSAHVLVQQGQYQAALEKYQEIQKNDSAADLTTEIENTKKLVQSNKMFQAGNQDILKDDFLGAVSAFKQVIPEDKLNYSKAEENIANLENSILDQAISLSKNGNLQEAQNLLSKYLTIVPESANALRLQKSLSLNPDTVSVPKTEPEQYEKTQKTEDDRAQMTEKAKSLLHSYQKIIAQKGNLRSEPDVNSSVLAVLPMGTDLYIKETKIEGSQRIWCHVEAKDPSTGEILDGWVSNKLMEK